MGATLHELGHLTHYWNNTYTNPNTTVSYSSTHLLLQESFASYVGWYLGEEYYKTVGKQMSNSISQEIIGNNGEQVGNVEIPQRRVSTRHCLSI